MVKTLMKWCTSLLGSHFEVFTYVQARSRRRRVDGMTAVGESLMNFSPLDDFP
jgi:hypothetical protein